MTREETRLLTKIGYLYLKNLGCFAISTEVKVWTWSNLRDYSNKQDKHHVIDLVGVFYKYLPYSEQYEEEVTQGDHTFNVKVIKKEMLRGVEIKNSRADFRNGFIHVGCNYHYLLFPKGLIDKSEVRTNIGLIEVDLDEFKVVSYRSYSGFSLTGIKTIRKPRMSKIPPRALSYVYGQMNVSLTNQVSRWLKRELEGGARIEPL